MFPLMGPLVPVSTHLASSSSSVSFKSHSHLLTDSISSPSEHDIAQSVTQQTALTCLWGRSSLLRATDTDYIDFLLEPFFFFAWSLSLPCFFSHTICSYLTFIRFSKLLSQPESASQLWAWDLLPLWPWPCQPVCASCGPVGRESRVCPWKGGYVLMLLL